MFGGGGRNRVAAGIFFIALGIGATIVSYLIATPGGVYYIYVGPIVGGFVMIVRGVITPGTPNGKLRNYSRSARSPMNSYVAPPEQMPRGYCWQCGRKVKAGRVVCLGCGATQIHAATSHRPGDSASQYGWDLGASTPPAVTPWGPPLPPRGATPAEQWNRPTYQPGGQVPWNGQPQPPQPPAPRGRRYRR